MPGRDYPAGRAPTRTDAVRTPTRCHRSRAASRTAARSCARTAPAREAAARWSASRRSRAARVAAGRAGAGGADRARRLELVHTRVELLDHRAERHDVQNTLTLTHQVDEILTGLCEHRVGAVEHEAGRRDLLSQVRPQVLDRLARGLERHARIEQALDHLEGDEVAIRVAALRATPLRVGQ